MLFLDFIKITKITRRTKNMFTPKTMMEEYLDSVLEDYSLEEIFEYLQIDVYEVLELAFETGLIDEDLIEDYNG
jgi:hypothetical protein